MTKSKMSTPTRSEIVLAIDPGFDRIGMAVMKTSEKGAELLFSECLLTKKKDKRGKSKKSYKKMETS